jgi:hypothetical protein
VANDMGDNEMILGLCTDLLAFSLQLRKTPETSARRPTDKGAVRPVSLEKCLHNITDM